MLDTGEFAKITVIANSAIRNIVDPGTASPDFEAAVHRIGKSGGPAVAAYFFLRLRMKLTIDLV
jgi:hypothetical protein